jgi:hypothetical protein
LGTARSVTSSNSDSSPDLFIGLGYEEPWKEP